ncbi:hypothetical protein K3495_g729 [Podosphaera aphanis]|nr:hypothetical protein K3495_g729 [Podosphaera aphanis]
MCDLRVTEMTLLSWVNIKTRRLSDSLLIQLQVNTFPLDTEVESTADLADGVVLSKMMENISSDYAVPIFEQNTGPSRWLSNKKTLEAVHKSLLRYIGDNCPNLDSVAFESRVDLNAIAEHEDPQETVKLLTIFLMAAVEGPNNRDYIGLITSKLDTSAQEAIKTIIMQANTIGQQTANLSSLPAPPNNDHELALEEAQANLYAEHEALKKKYADFMTRFERLTISHEELIQHSDVADARLKSLQESNDGDQTDFIKKQMERIRELEDIIAHQEQQLEADRVTKEAQYRELASVRPMAARLTECQDELKEVKVENLNLVKKANKVDHYLKKLENHTYLQRENAELREKIDLLEENQRDYDRVHEENVRYKTTATEYGSRFQEQELHIVEISSQKNALKHDIQILNQKIVELSERQQHDEKFINDLQEQIRTSSGPLSPGSVAPGQHVLSLEEELERVEDMPNYALENSRLKAEIKALQKNDGSSKIAQLCDELAEATRAKKQLEERYQGLSEKYSIAQQQWNAIGSNSSNEKNESLVKTRNLYIEACQELTSAKSKLAQLQSESSERDSESLERVLKLIDILHDSKDSKINHASITSLQEDLFILKEKYENILSIPGTQINKLFATLTLKEIQKNKETLIEQSSGHVEEGKKQGAPNQTQGHSLLPQDREEESNLTQLINSNDQKNAYETTLKNLTRENTLMATAWYDLMSRIQSNHLVVQRRQDVPKSWLNKQRLLVNNTGKR